MSGWNHRNGPPRGYKQEHGRNPNGHRRRDQWEGQNRRPRPQDWTTSNGPGSGWVSDMSHDEAQYSRRNDSGVSSHRSEDPEAIRLMEKLHEHKPYLYLRRKQIFEKNQQRELEDEVEEIDWILDVMSNVNADFELGTDTLKTAFLKVTELERLHPLPAAFAANQVSSDEEEEEGAGAGQRNFGPPPPLEPLPLETRQPPIQIQPPSMQLTTDFSYRPPASALPRDDRPPAFPDPGFDWGGDAVMTAAEAQTYQRPRSPPRVNYVPRLPQGDTGPRPPSAINHFLNPTPRHPQPNFHQQRAPMMRSTSFDEAFRSRPMDVYGQGRGHMTTPPQGYPSQEIPANHQFMDYGHGQDRPHLHNGINQGLGDGQNRPHMYNGVNQAQGQSQNRPHMYNGDNQGQGHQSQGHQAPSQYGPAPTQPSRPMSVPESRPPTDLNFGFHRRQDLPPALDPQPLMNFPHDPRRNLNPYPPTQNGGIRPSFPGPRPQPQQRPPENYDEVMLNRIRTSAQQCFGQRGRDPRSMGPRPQGPGPRAGAGPWPRPRGPRPPPPGRPNIVRPRATAPPPPIIPTQSPSSLTASNQILAEPPKKGRCARKSAGEAAKGSRGQNSDGADLSSVVERVKQKVATKVVPKSKLIQFRKTVEKDIPSVRNQKTRLSIDKEVDDGQRPGPSRGGSLPPSPPEVVTPAPARGRGRPRGRGRGRGKGSEVGKKVPPGPRSSSRYSAIYSEDEVSEPESDGSSALPPSTVSSHSTESVAESSTLGMRERSVSPGAAMREALLKDPEMAKMFQKMVSLAKLQAKETSSSPGPSNPEVTSVPTAKKRGRKPKQPTTSREKTPMTDTSSTVSSEVTEKTSKKRRKKDNGNKRVSDKRRKGDESDSDTDDTTSLTTKKKSKKKKKTKSKSKPKPSEDIWKDRGIVGPRDTVVNLGLAKVKMETDYVPPSQVKLEPQPHSDDDADSNGTTEMETNAQDLVEDEGQGQGQQQGQESGLEEGGQGQEEQGQGDEINDNDDEGSCKIKVEEVDVSDCEYNIEEEMGEIFGEQ